MEQEAPSFSKYGKDFQESLCQMILQDRPFADQIMEVLDINFLELHYLRVFVKKIFDYREKYDVHPTYKTMISIVRADIEGENAATQQQLRNYFARIHNTQVSGAEYVKSIALDFCRKQKLKEAMIKSVSLLQKSSFDEIAKIINDAIKLGDVTDFGYDYLKDFEKRFDKVKEDAHAKNDVDLTVDQLKLLCDEYKKVYEEQNQHFPSDPYEQLEACVKAVFGSWMTPRAVKYREINNIRNLIGTATNIQTMVFGNMGDDSGE